MWSSVIPLKDCDANKVLQKLLDKNLNNFFEKMRLQNIITLLHNSKLSTKTR